MRQGLFYGQTTYARCSFGAVQRVCLLFVVPRFAEVIYLTSAVQDAFSASDDREKEMKCVSSLQLCDLTSSSMISFSQMLACGLASSLCKS